MESGVEPFSLEFCGGVEADRILDIRSTTHEKLVEEGLLPALRCWRFSSDAMEATKRPELAVLKSYAVALAAHLKGNTGEVADCQEERTIIPLQSFATQQAARVRLTRRAFFRTIHENAQDCGDGRRILDTDRIVDFLGDCPLRFVTAFMGIKGSMQRRRKKTFLSDIYHRTNFTHQAMNKFPDVDLLSPTQTLKALSITLDEQRDWTARGILLALVVKREKFPDGEVVSYSRSHTLHLAKWLQENPGQDPDESLSQSHKELVAAEVGRHALAMQQSERISSGGTEYIPVGEFAHLLNVPKDFAARSYGTTIERVNGKVALLKNLDYRMGWRHASRPVSMMLFGEPLALAPSFQ